MIIINGIVYSDESKSNLEDELRDKSNLITFTKDVLHTAGVKPSVDVGQTPILDTKKDMVDSTKQPLSSPAVPPSKYTYDGLVKLNKKHQVDILNGLGITKIPSSETERINLILHLSEGV